ncbi:hypothetical protein HED50_22690 [Ochrobactrum oryzae]|nr:hypothetical protein [Brucella oryzae]
MGPVLFVQWIYDGQVRYPHPVDLIKMLTSIMQSTDKVAIWSQQRCTDFFGTTGCVKRFRVEYQGDKFPQLPTVII